MIKNSSVKLYQHIVVINRLISERVNNCRGLFPLRINWEYIKDIFIMPDGYTEEGQRQRRQSIIGSGNITPIRCI